MKIVTWNVNGIRTRPSLKEDIESLDADILCFQETKVTRDMLEEPVAVIDGYNSYFSFSRKKTGYSGVATYCRESCTPVKAEEGLSGTLASGKGDVGCYGNLGYFGKEELESLDAEGRAIITQHTVRNSDGDVKDLAIINVYVPRVDSERDDRKEYKLRFLTLLQTRAEALLTQGSYVIVVGDINISHRMIDHCNPDSEEFNLRPDRQWLNRFLWSEGQDSSLEVKDEQELLQISTPDTKSGQFIDSFRYFYPDEKDAFTCWCTLTSSRVTNYGTRLDYILGDAGLVKSSLKACVQMVEVQGSDHCPVKAEFSLAGVAAIKAPSLCTKYMPEFAGKQQKLSSFFVKAAKKESVNASEEVIELTSSQSSQESNKSVESNPEKKRPLVEDSGKPVLKKPKLESKKSSEEGKQANLMSFFRKKQLANTKPEPVKQKSNGDEKSSDITNGERIQDKTVDKKLVEASEKVVKTTDTKPETVKSSSAAWKGLLGGLGKPPLCKGHKEACVIRMVKKDGPNKFRQFYVCARAEGHSGNPEARCEHFEWLDKNKKKKL
ncbi:DNA-(apurinic or apyrimidinic site) endonuclease 2-like isoform X1 [Haliotis rubra]|uniref:DNA-(apurinic or apyrimidinic site) endonuclease 2-like isoform X1 n=2 Tax=Haliotis rubra TaxID=36100 RepID=UPI001EE548C5|nr:DNA-(apurinic or apyrimidinic site) endonuclease 2-like isoform X1 [Haliotis rubra]